MKTLKNFKIQSKENNIYHGKGNINIFNIPNNKHLHSLRVRLVEGVDEGSELVL